MASKGSVADHASDQQRRIFKPKSAALNSFMSNLQRSNARMDMIQENASRQKLENLNKLLKARGAAVAVNQTGIAETSSICLEQRCAVIQAIKPSHGIQQEVESEFN